MCVWAGAEENIKSCHWSLSSTGKSETLSSPPISTSHNAEVMGCNQPCLTFYIGSGDLRIPIPVQQVSYPLTYSPSSYSFYNPCVFNLFFFIYYMDWYFNFKKSRVLVYIPIMWYWTWKICFDFKSGLLLSNMSPLTTVSLLSILCVYSYIIYWYRYT